MMDRIRHTFARIWRDEDGNSSVEFMIAFPIYFSLLMMSLELSFITLRHTMLERGLDMAVREIRLGTGTAPTHGQIKTLVCQNALTVAHCEDNLKLEMIPTDIRNLALLDDNPDCVDAAAPSAPVKEFTPGQQNQLMFLRACLNYDPIFPAMELARAIEQDDNGQVSITSSTAFVQEPL